MQGTPPHCSCWLHFKVAKPSGWQQLALQIAAWTTSDNMIITAQMKWSVFCRSLILSRFVPSHAACGLPHLHYFVSVSDQKPLSQYSLTMALGCHKSLWQHEDVSDKTEAHGYDDWQKTKPNVAILSLLQTLWIWPSTECAATLPTGSPAILGDALGHGTDSDSFDSASIWCVLMKGLCIQLWFLLFVVKQQCDCFA